MGETEQKGPDEEKPENFRDAAAGTPPEAAARPGAPDESRENEPADSSGVGVDEPTSELRETVPGEELRRRLEAREHHLRELYDELAQARLAADEATARREAVEARARQLEDERDRLSERVREHEEEDRRRGRRREGQERHVARLGREIERRDAEIRRLEDLLAARRDEQEARSDQAGALAARRENDLKESLARIAELEQELDLRKRMADPTARMQAGIELFNESDLSRSVHSISRSMGDPEVRVEVEAGDDEPPTVLTFTWQDITWQTYHATPGLAVGEPRVYLAASGEDLSGVQRRPSNARIGPGGKVVLGL